MARGGQSEGQSLLTRWQELSQKWNLTRQTVFDLGLHASVQAVEIAGGRQAVLKIFITPGIFNSQLLALEAGAAVPEIIRLDRPRQALLLERLPGAAGVTGRFDLQRAVGAVESFHRCPAPEGLFDLVDYHFWIAESCRGFGLADRALERVEYFEGLNSQAEHGLVHGDLLPENIIFDRYRLGLIDPTGYRGDQAFDWATLALYSTTRERLRESLTQAAALSGYPLRRLLAWAWLRAVLSDAQAIKWGGDQGELQDRAEILEGLIDWD